jgi:DUF2075 family protein
MFSIINTHGFKERARTGKQNKFKVATEVVLNRLVIFTIREISHILIYLPSKPINEKMQE